jgi:hypothetical protein
MEGKNTKIVLVAGKMLNRSNRMRELNDKAPLKFESCLGLFAGRGSRRSRVN